MPATAPTDRPELAEPADPMVVSTDAERSDHRPVLVLFKFDSCPYCRRVARVISELQLDIPTRDTRQERTARSELFGETGRTQVPCLFIDGEPMFESEDIIVWLRENADRIARTSASA